MFVLSEGLFIMKSICCMLVAVSGLFFMSVISIADTNIYTPGTYRGEALGKKTGTESGQIEVEVTVSESEIVDIRVVTFAQHLEYKKDVSLVSQVKEGIPAGIIAKQSLDVDTIVGATLASGAIKQAVGRALDQAFLNKYLPGTYLGQSIGWRKNTSGAVELEVTVSANEIKNIEFTVYEQNIGHGKYAPLAAKAREIIPGSILAGQAVDVDTVAGATLSSTAIKKAVNSALDKAKAERIYAGRKPTGKAVSPSSKRENESNRMMGADT